MKKEVKIQAVLGTIIVLLLLVITIGIMVIQTRGLPEQSITVRQPMLTPRDHEIEVVEDLFIPFEFQDGSNFTFLMTENFSTLTITVQPDRTATNETVYAPTIEIDGGAEIGGLRIRSRTGFTHYNWEITGLQYNATYTLSIFRREGVAVAS